MAAARLVDELIRCALARHAIAVIGDEPRLAYNRMLLSSVLAGETAPEDIELKPMSWWRNRGVTLNVGCPATEIDVGRREIKIANDASVSFSRLVLATESAPLRLTAQKRLATSLTSLASENRSLVKSHFRLQEQERFHSRTYPTDRPLVYCPCRLSESF